MVKDPVVKEHRNKLAREYARTVRKNRSPERKLELLNRHRAKMLDVRYRSRQIHKSVKARAKCRGIPYDLSAEWIESRFRSHGMKCLLTGVPFDMTPDGLKTKDGPSIDRITAGGGYTMDNCRLVCNAINLGMNQFGEAILERISIAFLEKRGYSIAAPLRVAA